MKKHNTTNILLEPAAYWEKKLDINYNTEFLRYKKLCTQLTKQETAKLDGCYYITYRDWKEHIIEAIKKLDCLELQEYIRFLNNQSRKGDINIGLVQTVLAPCIVSLLSIVVQYIVSSLNFSEGIAAPVSIGISYIILIAFLHFNFAYVIKKLISESRHNSLHRSFYSDMQEIAIEQSKYLQRYYS